MKKKSIILATIATIIVLICVTTLFIQKSNWKKYAQNPVIGDATTGTNEYIGLVYCNDEKFNRKYKDK